MVSPDCVRALCADFLGGTWHNLSSDELAISPILGGLTNDITLCSMPSKYKTISGEPRNVLLRYYGSYIAKDSNRLARDAVIFALLAEKKLGPRLYGIFPGGRLEEYIPYHTLRPHEVSIPHVSLNVANKLAKLHSLSMPLKKGPGWIFDKMREFLDETTSCLDEHQFGALNSGDEKALDSILEMNISGEVDYLEEAALRKSEADIATLLPQVVFCHNDLNPANILMSDNAFSDDKSNRLASNDSMIFIDYEYSAYNYSAYDIANHFSEWTLDNNWKEAPYFRYEPQKWPSLEQQNLFIRRYLQTASPDIFGVSSEVDRAMNEKYIQWFLSSIKLHSLSSHLFFGLWSLSQYFTSKIQFGYLEYTSARISSYFENRIRIIE